MTSIKKALVVGGGIGGLSAGIALQKAGVDTEVIELQPEFNVYGVGIIQPSNALRALDVLGLGRPLYGTGFALWSRKNVYQHRLSGCPARYATHGSVTRS